MLTSNCFYAKLPQNARLTGSSGKPGEESVRFAPGAPSMWVAPAAFFNGPVWWPWSGNRRRAGSIPVMVPQLKTMKFKGLELIAEERVRQISEEGNYPKKDDTYLQGELISAAKCYVTAARMQVRGATLDTVKARIDLGDFAWWPWDRDSFKPDTPLRNLVKAGALIAAEIDRMHRAAERDAPEPNRDP